MGLSVHSLFLAVTDVGDTACLLAITLSGSVYLFCRSSGRAAMFLIITLLITATLTSLVKLAFLGCHNYFHHPEIHSPSGHAAMSTAVFWAYAILMRSQLEAQRRLLPLLLLTLLITLIAVSRVRLGMHTYEEVIVGVIIGIIGLFISYFFVLRKRTFAPFDAYALALWAVVPGLVVHGAHLPIEDLIHILAAHLKSHIALCGT
jgi:membrane-associated phospholipid phosphatase